MRSVTSPPRGSTSSTITVEGGSGNDEVDASGITSGHRVVFNGNDGDDTFTSGAGDDVFDGGEGLDTFIVSGNQDTYAITYNTDGTVTIDGADGTDTVSANVETIQFDDGPLALSPIWVFDGSNSFVSSYATIQGAIDASVDGYTIVVASGTYAEDLNINKAVTLKGANAGLAGDESGRGAETVIDGQITVSNASGFVAIDGIKVLNSSDNATSFNGLRVTDATDLAVMNSVFASIGANGNDDRGVYLTAAATGAILITENAFGGESTAKYSTANWKSGIWSDGAASSLTITDNAFDYVRTAMNLDSYDDATSVVSGNTISNSGSGISVGIGSDSTITGIDNNTFTGVDTDFNLQNLTTDIDFDIAGNNSPDGMVVLGGVGNDLVKGSDGDDFFDGGADTTVPGNDTFQGKGGDDIMYARDGDDTAVYTTALNAADIAAVNGMVIPSYGTHDGWVVNATAGGEGTDKLINVEIVENQRRTLPARRQWRLRNHRRCPRGGDCWRHHPAGTGHLCREHSRRTKRLDPRSQCRRSRFRRIAATSPVVPAKAQSRAESSSWPTMSPWMASASLTVPRSRLRSNWPASTFSQKASPSKTPCSIGPAPSTAIYRAASSTPPDGATD